LPFVEVNQQHAADAAKVAATTHLAQQVLDMRTVGRGVTASPQVQLLVKQSPALCDGISLTTSAAACSLSSPVVSSLSEIGHSKGSDFSGYTGLSLPIHDNLWPQHELACELMPGQQDTHRVVQTATTCSVVPSGLNPDLWTQIQQLVRCGYLATDQLPHVLAVLQSRQSSSSAVDQPLQPHLPLPVSQPAVLDSDQSTGGVVDASSWPSAAISPIRLSAESGVDPLMVLAYLRQQEQIELRLAAAALQNLQQLRQQNGVCASVAPDNVPACVVAPVGSLPLSNDAVLSASVSSTGSMPMDCRPRTNGLNLK
jgi:hypothetical protein